MFHSTLLKWMTVIVTATMLVGGWTRTSFSRADANTWYVATHGSDVSGDGSQDKSFSTIQHGIDISNNGDTVLVFRSLQENIDFAGKNILVGSFGSSIERRITSSRLSLTVISTATPFHLEVAKMRPPH